MIQSQFVFNNEDVSLEIPYYKFIWKSSGTHIVISGGMHGNEINGVMMIDYLRRLFLEKNIENDLIGTITLIPVLNPLAFQRMERYVPIDNKDLNRCFWKKTKTPSFSHKYAKFLLDTIFLDVDHAIDIHDAWGRSVLLPHPRIHSCKKEYCNDTVYNMARRFDSKIILERDGHKNMLAVYANDHLKFPVITLEIWGNQIIFENFYEESMRGIMNILQWLHYLSGDPSIFREKQYFVSERISYKAKMWWVVRYNVVLWQEVFLWDHIASIYYPLTAETQEIYAEEHGFIFSLWFADQIPQDANIVTVIS